MFVNKRTIKISEQTIDNAKLNDLDVIMVKILLKILKNYF